MAEAEIDNPEKSLVARLVPRRKRWRVTAAVLVLLLFGLAYAWMQRERIADDFVASQLEKYKVPGTYKVESIGPDRQVLTDIVIGDPDQPDLTIERAEIELTYGVGIPGLGRITLTKPRLFGTYRGNKLSFGALDPLVFAETGEPPGLPNLDLALIDGRALLETDYGPVAVKADGAGWLPSGFAGTLAATAPSLAASGCTISDATVFGKVTTATGQASLAGPLRVSRSACGGTAIGDSSAEVSLTASPTFDRVDGTAQLALTGLASGDIMLARLTGAVEASLTEQGLDARYDVAGAQLTHPQASLGRIELDGALRAREGFSKLTTDAAFDGRDLAPGPALDAALASAERGAEGTLAAPLLAQLRAALQRQLPGSRVQGNAIVRRDGSDLSVTVPAANLRGQGSANLASLTRFQLRMAAEGLPRFSGNLVTGGTGLPRIAGRMERLGNGRATFRLKMDEYAAGQSRLAIPQMYIAQGADGALGFSGEVAASGALPGGLVRNLQMPIVGSFAANGAVRVWPRCTPVRFDQLELANLALARRALTLCPGRNGAIVERGSSGAWRVAAGVAALDLAGDLSGTPIRITSGPVGLAWPGAIKASNVDIALGPVDAVSRFAIGDLAGTVSRGELNGTFAGTQADLASVPLDIRDAAGQWRYAGGALELSGAAFRLEDRQAEDRFEPMVARDAGLTLVDNRVRALAALRNPASDRVLSDAVIVHDLSTGIGYADLGVAGVRFDEALQPDMLSGLALGVIANARGLVTGTGRIDWNPDDVTSSGVFATDGLDFAAAFGPVRGASGTIRFADLLNLTTEPGQRLRVESVNPGIEALGGEIAFDLRDGRALNVTEGSWPFMGGKLTLEPLQMNFGVGEERRYVFRVEGLEAQRFVQQMELGNLNATGVFDGVLPIVFDEMGNGRIEGGKLDSRAPGGNVSYLGELSYEDMGAIANFAFAALRSLDYKVMEIRMDGPLTGEIVTRVRFDGVSQGEGTKSNFITRQIADLPIRFNVNIRAPFYQLITSIRAMYDPAFIRDPREIGLLSDDGVQLAPTARPAPDAIKPEDLIPDESPIQKQESESMP